MQKRYPESDLPLIKLEDGMCIGSGAGFVFGISSVQNQKASKSSAYSFVDTWQLCVPQQIYPVFFPMRPDQSSAMSTMI